MGTVVPGDAARHGPSRMLIVGMLVACNHETQVDPIPIVSPREPQREPKTCDEVRPEYSANLQAQQQAFERAREQRGFVPAKLELIWITDYRDKEPDYDQLLEISINRRRALIGMAFDRANGRVGPEVELVVDRDGGVWKVRRNPHASSAKTIEVKACQWGCFGETPKGAQNPKDYGHEGFVLRSGQTYKGEVVIDFTAPALVFKNTIANCSPPA